MHCVNNWHPPRWVRMWMLAATRGGDGWLWALMTPFVLYFGGAERWPAIAACTTACCLGVAVFVLIKRKTGRKRPCAIAEHCWATLLPPDQFSFPSGHTITAFAILTPLMFFYPVFLPLFLFLGISIGMSRILLGMHFLSDVLAGAALGIGAGYLCYSVYV